MPDEKTILLIEDDRETTATIHGVLEAAGYRVFDASNGIEGQKMIERHLPDLVITDMMMPRMGGFPVLDYLHEAKQKNRLKKLPRIIMITANEGGRHKAYAEMLGVDDYLRKPFAMELLLDSVERALSQDAKGKSSSAGKSKRATQRKA